MPAVSIFDIFKIGVGPSSSHTLGPWKAAIDFIGTLPDVTLDRLTVTLYGSLSKTGRGHATDRAVQLGLLSYQPEDIEIAAIPAILSKIRQEERLSVRGQTIRFVPRRDIIFSDEERSDHPNTLDFTVFRGADQLLSETYLSIGGGFVQKLGETSGVSSVVLPYPIETSEDLYRHVQSTGWTISEIVRQNEISLRPEGEITHQLQKIWAVMKESVVRGLRTEGILPGGLRVRRRAYTMSQPLLGGRSAETFDELRTLIRQSPSDFKTINTWISCFAMAVNEENAAMGRVVTSPTNGAAGVIPAVLCYYHCFGEAEDDQDVLKFFLTAGEIGSLFKKGATLSAAVGGCQAEIGVSSAMAAGGLTELLGGTPDQVLMAAEIAMEHHLGLTCDPVGGLVQVPCIERNAMGAMKAITAAYLSLQADPTHSVVKLDTVIKTMWDTAVSMNEKFKETSEGGLAFHIPLAFPEC